MVEVFKTNMNDTIQAIMVIAQIQKVFPHYKANFDLDDCDKILRVKTEGSTVEAFPLVSMLKDLGYDAEVLPDTPPAMRQDVRCWWQWSPQLILKTV